MAIRVKYSINTAPQGQKHPDQSASGRVVIKGNVNCLNKSRYGFLLYNKNDKYIGRSIGLYGEYSEFEVRLFQQIIKPGQTVLDIGANIGVFTLFFSRTVGPEGNVIAFEPQPVIHQMLGANLANNSILNTFTFQHGLGEKPGTAEIPLVDYAQENNFGGVSLGKFEYSLPVEVKTLDSFGLSEVHFIKIDVEGMEESVLKGGVETIKRSKPILFIENDRKEKSESLVKTIRDMGYECYWYITPLYNPDNYYKNPNNVFGEIRSKNMLCLPHGSEFEIADMQKV